MTPRLRASAAVIDVTPPPGFPLGGYIMRSGVSTGALDPISARLLLLTADDGELLLISLDWVHVIGSWVAGVRRAVEQAAGIRAADIIVTAIHTHSGPGIFASSPVRADGETAYLSEVTEKIAAAAGRLREAARDVTAFFGSARAAGIGANRNDPALAVDDELSLLTFTASDSTAVGRIIVYGCHPTLLGPDNLLFSADWVGRGRSAVDRGQGGVSLFVNGAAGDVSTRFTREGRDTREMEKYAALFSEAEFRAQKSSAMLSETGIGARTVNIPVSYRMLPERDEAQRTLSEAQEAVAKAVRAGANPGEVRRLESVREGALVTLFFAHAGLDALFGGRAMTAPVTLARIGSARLLLLPGEVMSSTSIDLKAARRECAVCGYANDYFGYLSRGGGQYESSMALLSPDSIESIIAAAGRLIREGV